MSKHAVRPPLIARFYSRFLDDGDAAAFVRSVAESYSLATLHRLTTEGGRLGRRAAVLAVTLVGRASSIAVVGRALRDTDRGVRLIAEDGIQAMWNRVGTFEQCQRLQMVMRLNAAGQHAEALQLADQILSEHPEFGEVWFQRSEALMANGQYREAIVDCRRALECENCHFYAALGLARCNLELGDLTGAVECLQVTLRIHPHWDFARAQMARLEREMREQTDRS